MKAFFEKNKVFLLGLLGAIGLALSSFVGQPELQVKPLVYAIMAAILSYVANNLRGQWVSIAGVLGTLLSTYITMEQTGTISWQQLILQGVVALLAIVAPAAKDQGYEKSPVIQQAKQQGEVIQQKIESGPPKQL